MNENEIKEKIEFAKKIADKFNEPYKTESFKIIFSVLMKNKNVANDSSENKDTDDEESGTSDKLEQKIRIPKNEIMNVVNFDNEKCELVNIIEANNPEKLLNGSLITLTVLRIKNNEEWVSSVKLGKILNDYGLNMGEVSRILQKKQNETYFRTKGTGKGLQYRITSEGIRKGISMIKESA